MQEQPAMTGPKSYYRPKDGRPVTMNLTREGRNMLGAITRRVKASRADVVEQLVRRFGDRVRFPPPEGE